jgi:hypothetical protein
MIVGAALLACGDDDEPPTASEVATFCNDLEDVQRSLQQVREDAPGAVLPGNQAAFQTTLERTRADVNALESSARELEGGSDAVAELRLDVQDFRGILAQPDLLAVMPQLQRKADEIASDLEAVGDDAQCPQQP